MAASGGTPEASALRLDCLRVASTPDTLGSAVLTNGSTWYEAKGKVPYLKIQYWDSNVFLVTVEF